MKVHVLGSGSRGNAVVIESDRTRLLVDAGFSPRRLAARMATVGVAPESISALVLTHEHSDHVSGAGAAARRWGWPVYGSAGTLAGSANAGSGQAVHARRELVVDDFAVRFVRTPHDAREPLAVVVSARSTGQRVGVLYDVGHVTPRLAEHFLDLDILLLESNHDEDMLWAGWYPRLVKERVAGPHGHLSNADAAVVARRCVHRGMKHLVLCHLSQNNNLPEVAIDGMRRALRGSAFHGTLHAAAQDVPLSVTAGRTSWGRQLALEL